MASKLVQSSAKPPNAGKGRKAGVPNKFTGQLKDMILNALDQAGGDKYLLAQAHDNPNAFLSLIGKVLPTTLAGHDGGKLTITVVTGVERSEG